MPVPSPAKGTVPITVATFTLTARKSRRLTVTPRKSRRLTVNCQSVATDAAPSIGPGSARPAMRLAGSAAALSSAAFRVHCHKVCPDGTARAIRLDPARHTVRSAAALSSAAPPSA